MSPAGRTVPWCCWEEWLMVKDWLLSTSQDRIKKGIQRVEAWRARGRLPLGVDITASLLETALCDSSFWGSAAASAAVGTSAISQQQTRLQYSATIVRMVNGIADSQQKGRIAVSVNSLAEAAGLSRLLVDIRHEATHNELPSLATLQLAAKQALDWLMAQYWYVPPRCASIATTSYTIELKDGSSVEVYEHGMTLFIVALRGSIPEQWVLEF
eukprot:gene8867-9046_t